MYYYFGKVCVRTVTRLVKVEYQVMLLYEDN